MIDNKRVDAGYEALNRLQHGRSHKQSIAVLRGLVEDIKNMEELLQNVSRRADETQAALEDADQWKARAQAAEQMSFVYRETIKELRQTICDLWIKTQK